MWIIDRSPGLFIVLANLVVYGVIGVEVWMWTAASVLAVVGTLTLIAVTAGVICHATLRLMDDAAPGPVSVPVVREALAPAAAVVAGTASPRPAPARPARSKVAHVG